MSSSLPRAHGKGAKTELYVGLVRADATSDGFQYRGRGYMFCTSCGGGGISKAELANAAGVQPREITKFLERANQRPDIAARIRAKVAQVIE